MCILKSALGDFDVVSLLSLFIFPPEKNLYSMLFLLALAGVAQWIEHWSVN